ncbi:colanic acid biosynthesis glycosyl transferase WcaI [Enhydrobacter aerosaccus]|uniref:Colanic acid biosynthesis glycosyl transferase WcaI n=1 Tax=Enhydrobacter aerosaccus TaxID=225324 RepID=A0A1T4SQJ8_9HYPH|nr:glycosyltransferase [Enhydrobacter aerosaccus]SKA30443.1 colanic acid biosynthesis glycosyl transferase WcaI [Enhydrobacter aerosaccus]
MAMESAPSTLFVTRYFWPELIGSAPFTSDIAEWLARHGRPTTVLSGLPHYPSPEVFPGYRDGRRKRETVGSVTVERVRSGAPRNASALWRIVNEADFLVRGLGALASGRVSRHPVVLALCPSILCVTLGLAARQRGGLCVAIVHDIQSGLAERLGMGSGRLGAVMRAAERLMLNRVDLVVVLSEEMRDQLRGIGVTTPIEVVPLWVDTDHIQPIEPETRSVVKVLYSGNLGRKQGLGQVVEMAEQLALQRPEIEIELRGNGNQVEALAAEIAQRRLGNVKLAELRPNEDLARALCAGDIHLVPQNPQAAAFAVPSKVYNIMAVGRPFVATALPNSTLWHLQRQSDAFLCVPPNDPSTFAEAVVKLADNERLRHELGRNGRAFVERHYAKPRILGNFLKRLDALVAR